MREKRIEVRLGTKMENLGIVRVVYVRKNAQELAVDVLCC